MSSFSSTFDPIDRNNGVNKCPCVKKSTSKPFGSIKSTVNSSPFVYGAKKITFSVKQRESFWQPYFGLRNGQIERALILNYVMSETKPQNILEKPISPVLALTLLLLDHDVFQTNKLAQFLDDFGYVRVMTKKGAATGEAYQGYLPGYLNIHAFKYKVNGSKTGFDKDNTFTNSKGEVVIPESLTAKESANQYMVDEGVFKKLSGFSYGVKSSDIEVLRGAYGYGPACIGAFLNICRFKKEIIPDLICGILISEDSGMTVGDAVDAIQQWSGFMPQDKYFDFSVIANLGTFRILSILEEIGTYFLLSLLGHTFKKNIHFHFQLTPTERKVFEAGYLIGDVNADLTRFARYIINNRLYLEKSIEVFSISTPCIMNTDGNVVDSHLELGDYKRDFYGLTLFENNPLLEALNIGKCLEDIKEFNYLVNPLPGYTISELMNKNITDCFCNNIVNAIGSLTDKRDASIIKQKIPADLKIAPRTTTSETTFDYKYSNPLYRAESKLGPNDLVINEVLTVSFNKPEALNDSVITTIDTNTGSEISGKLNLTSSDNLVKSILEHVNSEDVKFIVKGTNTGTITSSSSTLTFTNIKDIVIPDFDFEYGGQKIHLRAVLMPKSYDNTTGYSDNITLTCTTAPVTSGTPVESKWNSQFLNILIYSIPDLSLPTIIEKTNRLLKDNNCTLEKQINSICTPGKTVDIDDDTAKDINIALDKIGLAILRICLINAFCNSYSLDLSLQNDAMRRFYNIFIGYVRDYVDISVTTLK